MTILVILAIGLLVPAAAAVLAQRRSLATRLADIRGVALQTVIVIVVMLVIAGAVAGVLLSRGGDVVSDLEGQQVGPVTEDNCQFLEIGGKIGTLVTTSAAGPASANTTKGAAGYPATWSSGDQVCFWLALDAQNQEISRAQCTVVGGAYKEDAAVTATLGGITALAADDDICMVVL